MLSKVKLLYRFILKNAALCLGSCLVIQALVIRPSYEAALFLCPVLAYAAFNEYTRWKLRSQVVAIQQSDAVKEVEALRSAINQLRLNQTYTTQSKEPGTVRRMF